MQFYHHSKDRGGKLQIGPHHCDQWPKLPQIHILEHMLGAVSIEIQFQIEFEFYKDLKKKKKRKEKGTTPNGLASAGAGPATSRSLPSVHWRRERLGRAHFAATKERKKRQKK